MLGNADVGCPIAERPARPNPAESVAGYLLRRPLAASLSHAWSAREMAMSELKQQTIALWILLMLLILVPWALE